MSKKIFMIIASLLAIIILAAFTLAQKKSIEFKDITFKVIPDKDSYIKGEPVNLKVELTNNSDYTINFVELRGSRLWVAKEDEGYKFYDNDPRDCSTSDSSLLRAKQSWVKNMETLLWNSNRRDYSRFTSDTVTNSAQVLAGAEGSFIFQEVIADQKRANIPRLWLTAIPHEVGHQFGIKGDGYSTQWGIMGYGQNVDYQFHPQHINIMRWRQHSPGKTS
jgi:hypothetical protein